MIPIYISSFFRYDATEYTIGKIHERTDPGTFQIHVYDNGSDPETQDKLYDLLKAKKIVSLTLDSRNTGCLYNKIVYHAMTESSEKYFMINDNDVHPPLLYPSWLTLMIAIMDKHPELAFLTPQLPPLGLQEPYEVKEDIVYCKGVGNTLKLVRREAFPTMEQKLGAYGDDGWASIKVHEAGWKVAFCRNIFCWHDAQRDNYGYKPEELDKDPRKKGYGEPFRYDPINWYTYEPPASLRL